MNGKLARSLRKHAIANTVGKPDFVTRFHYKRLKRFYKFLQRK